MRWRLSRPSTVLLILGILAFAVSLLWGSKPLYAVVGLASVMAGIIAAELSTGFSGETPKTRLTRPRLLAIAVFILAMVAVFAMTIKNA
jgi:hypothetical protein